MQANVQAEVFTTEQVAAALGMRSAAQLSNWLRRGFALVDPDHETPGTGKMRLFTAARAVQIAIAARLIQSGIPVTDASLMAAEFSDFGISVGWSGQADPEHERGAGGLFSRGTTVMRVVFGEGDEKPSHEILRFEEDIKGADVFRAGTARPVVLLLNLNHIVMRTRMALGLSALP
jgi:hypothetical protein